MELSVFIKVWIGTASETIFKNAMEGSNLRDVYDKKIANVELENQLNTIGWDKAVHKLINGDTITMDFYESFIETAAFLPNQGPCKIKKINTLK